MPAPKPQRGSTYQPTGCDGPPPSVATLGGPSHNSSTLKAVASLICPDFAGPDRDGLNNSQEWRADTNPMDALSALKMTSLDLGLTEMPSYQETASAPTRFFRLKCSLQ